MHLNSISLGAKTNRSGKLVNHYTSKGHPNEIASFKSTTVGDPVQVKLKIEVKYSVRKVR